jgi:hypothetical protein
LISGGAGVFMIWDKIFWLWFFLSSIVIVILLFQETTLTSMAIGMFQIGLGFLKLAEEGNRGGPARISKRLLKILGKG